MRHGSNPGTVVLDGQKVPIRVPRVRGEQAEIPLRSYQGLHGTGAADEALLRRVLYGISCRNYEAAARAIPGAIGLSSSSVSRAFIEASGTKLKEFQERDLKGERYVTLFLDGKSFADTTLVIALGVTSEGTKRFLGFVETDTENEKVLTPFLRSLIERGLDRSQGLLVVIDGGKGLRSAVRAALHVAQAGERGELPAQERAGELAPAAAARLRPADLSGSARRADPAAARTRGAQPVGRREPGRGPRGDAHAPPARRLRAAGPVVQDHQLHRVGERVGRGALRQGGRLEDFEPAAPLAGDGTAPAPG